MNLLRSAKTPHLLTWMCALFLVLIAASAVTPTGAATPETIQVAAVSGPISAAMPPASFWDNIMGNRRRMIQVGLVAVCLGFLLLSWSRK